MRAALHLAISSEPVLGLAITKSGRGAPKWKNLGHPQFEAPIPIDQQALEPREEDLLKNSASW